MEVRNCVRLTDLVGGQVVQVALNETAVLALSLAVLVVQARTHCGLLLAQGRVRVQLV